MKPKIELKIAGITVKIAGNCPEGALRGMEAYETRETASEVDDILCINCDIAAHLPARQLEPMYGVRHLIEEYGYFGGSFISQDRSGDSSLATLTFAPDFHSVSCTLVDVEARGGGSLNSRMKVAIGDCVRNSLPAYGALTYHASSIAYKGSALLFAAPAGTGKSTQSRLWREYYPEETQYINDDTPIIKKKNGVFCAYGSPWAGTTGINSNISAPIKAIIYVKRGTDNTVRPLIGQEKMLRALRSVREQKFPVQRERQVRLMFELMSAVPTYELSCDMSRGAVEAVRSLLF